MKCPKCQSENTDTARFCSDCGTSLTPIDEAQPSITKTIETPREELTTGSTFAGRYQIIEELGKGGMGKVYKVLDKETNEKIALKLIKSDIAADKKTVERFRNELTTARKIVQKNVCRMFDLGREKDSYYITMEYISGQDLRDLIRQTGQLTVGKAVSIAKQICDGLSEAHSLGVVHRDLKPNNIMIDKGGNAKIMDFGIARAVKGKSITGSGVMVGTPQYMSPEQVEGKDVDLRSDIYSLGILLYEMLTDRVPFEGDTPLTIGVKQKTEIPIEPNIYNERIGDPLNRLILKCLEKDKENRYQSAKELKSDLDKLEQGLPTTERTGPRTKPHTSREITVQFSFKRRILPIAVVLLVIAAGLLFWRPWKRKTAPSAQSSRTSIAVAYFNNRLVDQDMDDYIIEMFSINLGRFDELKVLPPQLLADIFSQIRTDTSQTIDESTALPVAERVGAEYIVAGSVYPIGNKISLTTQLIDVQEGENLAHEEVEGQSLNDIQNMVDVLTERLCLKLGITQDETEPVKIAAVTTESLEAFGHYQKGISHFFRFERVEAIEEFQKAIICDPEFAVAHVFLSFAQANPLQIWNPYGNLEESRKTLEKAEQLSSKIREQERMMIAVQKALYERENIKYRDTALDFVNKYPEEMMANFSLMVGYYMNGEFEKAKTVLEKYLEINPVHAQSYNMLAYTQAYLNNHTEAVSAVNKYIRLDSDIPVPYDSAWEVCMVTGDYDKALDYCRQAIEQFPESGFYWHRGFTYLIKGDVDSARLMFGNSASERSEEIEQVLTKRWFDGVAALYEGKLSEAYAELGQRFDLLREENLLGRMSRNLQSMGKIRVYQGKYQDAIDIFERAEQLSWEMENSGFNPYPVLCRYKIGLAQIGKGDFEAAQTCVENIKNFIQQQGLEDYYLSFATLVEGALQIARKNGTAALEILDQCPGPIKRGPDCTMLVAEACVLNKDFNRAAELYNSYKTDVHMVRNGNDSFLFYRCSSLVEYHLGKVYELQGRTSESVAHYEKFLDLWKDADPGLPEVADARERVAALRQQ